MATGDLRRERGGVVEKINGGCGAAADGGGDTAGHEQRFDNRWARDRAGRGVHLAGGSTGWWIRWQELLETEKTAGGSSGGARNLCLGMPNAKKN